MTAAAILCIVATLSVVAQAAVITVDSLADDTAAGHCTLREAINSANGSGAAGNCTAGDGNDTIKFGVTGTIMLSGTPGGGLPNIMSVVTITGPASVPGITINGNNGPVMSVNRSATLNVANLTIEGGNAQIGGAILNQGKLNVSNCVFSGNFATQVGGAIYNEGTGTITDSTFSANRINSSGGSGNGGAGIYNVGPSLTVTDSTFVRNYGGGGAGGGIANYNAMTVTNSTFSANSANSGGGIYNFGLVNVTNCTFAGNSALSGGGISNGAEANLQGTILAHESTGSNCGGVRVSDAGYNLSDDRTCHFSAAGSRNNVKKAMLNLDPKGLQNNGGPTQTIALLAGSVAIDQIPPPSCKYPSGSSNPCTGTHPSPNQLICDQRGMPRPDPEDGDGGNCDIGAYEFQDSSSPSGLPPGLTFAGDPGKHNCHGESVSALAREYGNIRAAAAALHFPGVKALQRAIHNYCRG